MFNTSVRSSRKLFTRRYKKPVGSRRNGLIRGGWEVRYSARSITARCISTLIMHKRCISLIMPNGEVYQCSIRHGPVYQCIMHDRHSSEQSIHERVYLMCGKCSNTRVDGFLLVMYGPVQTLASYESRHILAQQNQRTAGRFFEPNWQHDRHTS